MPDSAPLSSPKHSASASQEDAHDHGNHGHSHRPDADVGTTRLVLAIVFNALITAAEFVAGFVAGSLALMADAAHNLSDTASMGTSLVARKIATRAADARRTFGYERAELIGAFINLLTLVLIALYLLVEAGQRYFAPTSIDGTLMIWVGAATLVGNVATAFVLHKPAQDSLNIKSAFVHIVADALGSVAVVAGGVLIQQYGWTFVDPLLTALIAGYILVHSYGMLRETISILMESAPRGFDIDALIETTERITGVRNMHHVHVWRLDEHRVALEAHVDVEGIRELDELDRLKQRIKTLLHDQFAIDHATLELEHGRCTDADALPTGPAQGCTLSASGSPE
ncbi:cation diffusion facilitator family transporter [Longimonas halophila]|nr:cation diffusion facilitator family transporter [Longimonas halophila]